MARRLVEKTKAQGIYRVHTRGCDGSRCRCASMFEATVYASHERKLIRKRHRTLTEAKRWRSEISTAAGKGEAVVPTRKTVNEAADELIAGMKAGTIMNRSGRVYKPSVVRGYEASLRLHIRPEIGTLKLSQVNRDRVRRLLRKWTSEGQTPSTVRNNLDPLRVIFREALEVEPATTDPTAGLRVPHGSGRRERVANRAEAQQLIDALPAGQQAFWACAFYGGLRRGELRALRWDDVDLDVAGGAIHVRRSWDDHEGDVATKTVAGERAVPLAGVLRRLLLAHKLASGRNGDELVFGRTAVDPFIPSTLRYQARAVWEQAGLTPISPHEARHSAASYLIEAGLNDLELTTMIGHSDPRTTQTIYGHLFPDSRKVVTGKLDAYLTATGTE
jgi:integrase